MKKILPVVFVIFLATSMFGQTPTWSEDVAPIVFKKCTPCHHQGGIGPMSFMSYTAAFPYASWMSAEVAARRMPPWPPDTAYQRYVHDYNRILTTSEMNAIVNWAGNGAPEGDTTKLPPTPVYNNNLILGTPDLRLQIPKYKSKAVVNDDYVCFSIPANLAQSRSVRAVEVSPGNSAIVHHALVFIDTAGTYSTDTSGTCGGPTNAILLGSYEPGGSPTVFPDDGNNNRFGVTIPPGANIVLAMHYPHGSAGQWDSTTVNLHFYPTSATVRPVFAGPIIQNWSFCVDADSVQSFTAQYPPGPTNIPLDVSVLSVFPHMHLLGQYIDCYSVDQNNDTLNLIRINDWNFDWQDSYFFRYIQKIPSGSKVYSKATYDNTSGNPYNPNSPPQQVCAGLNTTDEMFLVFIHYTAYLPGDENINQDSLRTLTFQELVEDNKGQDVINLYPNPFGEELIAKMHLKDAAMVSFTLHDMNGRVLKEARQYVAGGEQVIRLGSLYKGTDKIPPGIYFQKIKYDGKSRIVKLIKQ